MEKLTIQDLFPKDGKYTFLVGAGCSIDAPSCLPAGRLMMEAIIRHSCAESEVEKILSLENLRFEQLVELISKSKLDPELKIIDYYGLCDKPNSIHFFLAEMIKRGHYVITTNFDYLLEYALLNSNIDKKFILPVITKDDFTQYADVQKVMRKGMYPIYKIHGSPRNIISDTSTKESLIATIQAFGSGKEGDSVFQLEPHKRPLFENITKDRTLIVMGYSGSDDFDIVPTLKLLKNLKQIVWIEHETIIPKPTIENFDSDIAVPKEDKIGEIFQEIHQMGYGTRLVRVKMPTSELGSFFTQQSMQTTQNSFDLNPLHYLQKEVLSSNQFLEYMIPFKIYNDLSQIDDAARCANIVLKRAIIDNNLSWQSIVYSDIGRIVYGKGNLDEAMNHYVKALSIDEQLGDIRKKAFDLSDIGLILRVRGQTDEAINHYKEALKIHQDLENLLGKAVCLNNIGSSMRRIGEHDQALQFFNEALSISYQLGDLRQISTNLNSIASLLEVKGNLDQALHYYNEALKISEQLGNNKQKSAYLNNIGLLLKDKGELDSALHYYEEALAIDEQLGDLNAKAADLNNIGNLLKEKGDPDKGLHYYQQALEISEQIGDLESKATYLNNIGLLIKSRGELDQAMKYYKNALEIFEEISKKESFATCLGNIGVIFYQKGDLDKALQTFKEAIAIDEELGDLRGKATRLNYIGSILDEKGKLRKALRYYKEALAINEKLENWYGKATLLNNIGLIYKSKGKYHEARQYYEEALSIDKKIQNQEGIAIRLINIGALLDSKTEFDKKKQYYDDAFSIYNKLGDRLGKTSCMHQLGSLFYNKSKYQEALNYFEECLKIREELGLDPGLINSTKKWIKNTEEKLSREKKE